MERDAFIIGPDDLILITGATGFIGRRLVECLLERGFRRLRCFVRSSSNTAALEAICLRYGSDCIEVVKGNLLSIEDCAAATSEAAVIYHLAAGTGQKSFPEAFMNSVLTTRNLLEGALKHRCLSRFVNVSSIAVYSNVRKPRGRLLDESCPLEDHPELRGEAYCFAKVKQEQIVQEYCSKFDLPYVIVRPGYVYGSGKKGLTNRVGIDTFGVFLHLGGPNKIPCTYIDNCADAIALAGLKQGIDGGIFNVVDDDLPSSRQLLRLYKKNVKNFRSFYVPHVLSYALSYLWERYSTWSHGQLPPTFNRRGWNAYWRETCYSNQKLKEQLGWTPKVPTSEGLRRYLEACRDVEAHA